MLSKFPLTVFLIKVMEATPDQLRRANPSKMAKKYGIREQDAEAYIKHELMMRGGGSRE